SCCYSIASHAHADPFTGGGHFSADPSVRYADTFVRVDGRWRITERRRDVTHVPETRLPSSDDPAVQYLLDRAGISDVTARSSWPIDRRDFGMLGRCFRADAHAEYGDTTLESADGVVDHLRAAADQVHGSSHFLGNQLVNVDGAVARADTYAYVSHQDEP